MPTPARLTNLVESQQLDLDTLHELFRMADNFRKAKGERLSNVLQGKILATLFYEPSTRTRLSFESAMLRLGGRVLSTENAKDFSSAVKGESLEDTIRVVSAYADCIAMRHYEEGAAKRAAQVSRVPVINAGGGKDQHPTQALLDLYTIYNELGRIDGIKIAMVGDLTNGRTVRSLSYLLGKCKDIEVVFISPPFLRMRDDIKEYLAERGVKFREEGSLNKVLLEMDVVYMVRTQTERMTDEEKKAMEGYERKNGKFCIDSSNLNLMKKSARLMHPLPKRGEIDLPISVEETDRRVAYFRQAENGLYVRMALLAYLLGK